MDTNVSKSVLHCPWVPAPGKTAPLDQLNTKMPNLHSRVAEMESIALMFPGSELCLAASTSPEDVFPNRAPKSERRASKLRKSPGKKSRRSTLGEASHGGGRRRVAPPSAAGAGQSLDWPGRPARARSGESSLSRERPASRPRQQPTEPDRSPAEPVLTWDGVTHTAQSAGKPAELAEVSEQLGPAALDTSGSLQDVLQKFVWAKQQASAAANLMASLRRTVENMEQTDTTAGQSQPIPAGPAAVTAAGPAAAPATVTAAGPAAVTAAGPAVVLAAVLGAGTGSSLLATGSSLAPQTSGELAPQRQQQQEEEEWAGSADSVSSESTSLLPAESRSLLLSQAGSKLSNCTDNREECGPGLDRRSASEANLARASASAERQVDRLRRQFQNQQHKLRHLEQTNYVLNIAVEGQEKTIRVLTTQLEDTKAALLQELSGQVAAPTPRARDETRSRRRHRRPLAVQTGPSLESVTAGTEARPSMKTVTAGTEAGPSLKTVTAGTEAGPSLKTVAAGTEARPSLETVAAGTEARPSLESVTAGTEAGPSLETVAAGTEAGPSLETVAAGTEARPSLESVAAGTEAGPSLESVAAGSEAGPSLESAGDGDAGSQGQAEDGRVTSVWLSQSQSQPGVSRDSLGAEWTERQEETAAVTRPRPDPAVLAAASPGQQRPAGLRGRSDGSDLPGTAAAPPAAPSDPATPATDHKEDRRQLSLHDIGVRPVTAEADHEHTRQEVERLTAELKAKEREIAFLRMSRLVSERDAPGEERLAFSTPGSINIQLAARRGDGARRGPGAGELGPPLTDSQPARSADRCRGRPGGQLETSPRRHSLTTSLNRRSAGDYRHADEPSRAQRSLLADFEQESSQRRDGAAAVHSSADSEDQYASLQRAVLDGRAKIRKLEEELFELRCSVKQKQTTECRLASSADPVHPAAAASNPFPSIVRLTEVKLQEAYQQIVVERNRTALFVKKIKDTAHKLEEATAASTVLKEQLTRSVEERQTLQKQLTAAETAAAALRAELHTVRQEVQDKESLLTQTAQHLEERIAQVAALSRDLESLRAESARDSRAAAERADELLARVSDIEQASTSLQQENKRLRQAREEASQLAASERQLRQRAADLQERLDQSTNTARMLDNYIHFLKASYSAMFGAPSAGSPPLASFDDHGFARSLSQPCGTKASMPFYSGK